MRNVTRGLYNAQISGGRRNRKEKSTSSNEEYLWPINNFKSRQKIANENFPSVSTIKEEDKKWSGESNPVTRWTIEEYHPYNSYSYHVHNVKSPKKEHK